MSAAIGGLALPGCILAGHDYNGHGSSRAVVCRECRFARGDFVGNPRRHPESVGILWGRRPTPKGSGVPRVIVAGPVARPTRIISQIPITRTPHQPDLTHPPPS